MVDYKEMAIYLVIAIVIILAVIFVAGRGLLSTSYDVTVNVSTKGAAAVYPYQTSQFLINVTNKGSSSTGNLLVGFYLNGEQISANSVIVPPHESVVLYRNYTYQYPGTYSFQAVADPAHLLQIANRNATQSYITENISQTEPADPYLSIPNSNITGTESFTISGTGALSSAAVASKYNITLFEQLFGPGGQIPLKVVENLYGYIAYSNGAYAVYSNNSIAYTDWLQGTVDSSLIKYVVSSFGVATEEVDNVSYSILNNRTSMCIFYNKGWTEIVSYYNNSLATTCLGLVSNTYPSTENLVFVSLLKNNTNLTRYQSEFTYTNSTNLGTILEYSKSNVTVTNLFQNDYGFFASSIMKLNRSINVTVINYTCNGLIYNNSNLSVCSYLIPTINGSVSLSYGVVNSTYITPHYIFSMYSLVNDSELVGAHGNAANLMQHLHVNTTSFAEWQSVFKNGCSFENQSIGCKFGSFDKFNDNATINITNKFNSSITLNKINCEVIQGFKNVTVNETIGPGALISLPMHCNLIAVPSTAGQTSYILILNYTYRNVTKIVGGFLNVSNQ